MKIKITKNDNGELEHSVEVDMDIGLGKAYIKDNINSEEIKTFTTGAVSEGMVKAFKEKIIYGVKEDYNGDIEKDLENYLIFELYKMIGIEEFPLELHKTNEGYIVKGLDENVEYEVIEDFED